MENVTYQGIRIAAAGRNLITPVQLGSLFSARFSVVGKPQEVTLVVTPEPIQGTTDYSVFASKAEPIGHEGFTLTVPVRWEGDIPHTRAKGVDNVDVIRLGHDGSYLDLQVGVITRRGRFYVTVQQIFKGHVARTRTAGSNEVEYEFVPTDPIHAYGGARYQSIWAGMAEELERVARELGASKQLSRVRDQVATWAPPRVTSFAGWDSGVVRYYNMITGTGEIENASTGDTHRVHFSAIIDGGDVPVLVPMTGVHYRLGGTQMPVRSVKAAKDNA